jgi:hypothetical protein
VEISITSLVVGQDYATPLEVIITSLVVRQDSPTPLEIVTI